MNGASDSVAPEAFLAALERPAWEVLQETKCIGYSALNDGVDRIAGRESRFLRLANGYEQSQSVPDPPNMARNSKFPHASRSSVALTLRS